MNALEENRFTRDWQHMLAGVPTPRLILSISAHWVTRGPQLTGQAHPPTLHDFGGFPPALYQQYYPCPGDPDSARQIASLLGAQVSKHWGLDHGTWCVLKHVFPNADIPVVQLSLDNQRDPAAHAALAAQLKPLRDDGVLIMGSGNIVHNLARWFRNPDDDTAWALAFDSAVTDALLRHDIDALCRLPFTHQEGCEAVPTL